MIVGPALGTDPARLVKRAPAEGERVLTTVPVGTRPPGLVGTVLPGRAPGGCDVLVQLDVLDKPLGFTRFEVKAYTAAQQAREAVDHED